MKRVFSNDTHEILQKDHIYDFVYNVFFMEKWNHYLGMSQKIQQI